MSKLVWREHSPYNISLHCVQEYVIRQCRYKTANSPWTQCQRYITGCRAHLHHLPGFGQVEHSPRGTSGNARTLGWGPMWSGSLSSSYQPSDQPKAWQVDILSHGWLVGQLQLASWLIAYWTKCQPDPHPKQRYLVAMCVTVLVTQTCGLMYPLVEICCGQVRTHVAPHETSGQVGIWSDVGWDAPHKWKSRLDRERLLTPWTTSTPRKTFYPGG